MLRIIIHAILLFVTSATQRFTTTYGSANSYDNLVVGLIETVLRHIDPYVCGRETERRIQINLGIQFFTRVTRTLYQLSDRVRFGHIGSINGIDVNKCQR